MGWFGDWFDDWFGNWFDGDSGGSTTHSGSGGSTTPAVIGSGNGTITTSTPAATGGDWAALMRWLRARRRRHRAAGTASTAAITSTGHGQVHHRGSGAGIIPSSLAGTGAIRRRRVGVGTSTLAPPIPSASCTHDDLLDLALLLALE
jgi:hypothetical protein